MHSMPAFRVFQLPKRVRVGFFQDGDWTIPKPSIHMPRWASRLILIVTDVRVQRLVEISEDDARAEGIYEFRRIGDGPGHAIWGYDGCEWRSQTPSEAFVDLWDSLSKPGATWANNPWVVAITFIPHRCNIDALNGTTHDGRPDHA